jgi:hypothetical protein
MPRRPVRVPRPAPPESPATVYPAELRKQREWLDGLRVHHIDLAQRVLLAHDGALYTIDLVMLAAVSRSYSLVEGFLDAFDNWNLFVAAPIVRMQIDTLVRIAYLARVSQADEFALKIIGGSEFRSLEDAEGNRLFDRRLLEHAQDVHPWLGDVYAATSGWVHFSPDQVHASWKVEDNEEGEAGFSSAIPMRPERIPCRALQELLGAMTQATEEFFAYVEAWESRKGLPPWQKRDLKTGEIVNVGEPPPSEEEPTSNP